MKIICSYQKSLDRAGKQLGGSRASKVQNISKDSQGKIFLCSDRHTVLIWNQVCRDGSALTYGFTAHIPRDAVCRPPHRGHLLFFFFFFLKRAAVLFPQTHIWKTFMLLMGRENEKKVRECQ